MEHKNLILVAEDDEVSFQFLNVVLEKIGIGCIRANNGVQAIEIMKSHPEIKLVMMDIKMPKLDGLSATKAIKSIRPDIIIVAQTAYALNSEKAKFLREGCDAYISKPIDIDLLKGIMA
jgi:CheY-like chemotaxis protein